MALITKKKFKEQCDLTHVYGRGANRINAIYFDWQETETGRGFKYGVVTSVENCTKAELFNHLYEWVCNNVYLPYYVYSKFAQYDNQRFKTPISLNLSNWN